MLARLLRLLLVLGCLGASGWLAAAPAAAATLTPLTDPSAIPNQSAYDFASAAEGVAPAIFPGGTLAHSAKTYRVSVVPSSWKTWNPQTIGLHVLEVWGTVDISFTTPQSGVAVQAEPNTFLVEHDITMEAFDAGGASLGSTTRAINGTSGAAYLGLLAATPVIARVRLSTNDVGFAFTHLTYGVQSPVQTALTVGGSATYGGGSATLTATLTTPGPAPVAGETVAFRLNGVQVCGNPGGGYATPCPTTDSGGTAQLTAPLGSLAAGTYKNAVAASFAGTPALLASSATGKLVVDKAVLWLKPVDQRVKKGQVSTLPTGNTCPIQVAPNTGSAFVGTDTLASSVTTTYLRCSYTASNTSPAGSYLIVGTAVTAPNYEVKWKTGVLTVTTP